MRLFEVITTAKFQLPSGFDPAKYQITNSLRDVKKWKAYTYDGKTTCPKGTFGNVGYTMISLKDNTIIPISRGDEHHRGYDTLWDLSKKIKTLNPRDYIPIWAGNNYIYNQSDIPKFLLAFKKWFLYGGPDGILKGGYDLSNLAITAKEFVERNGDITIKPGMLAPIGQALYNAYKKLSDDIVITVHKNPENSDYIKIWNDAKIICSIFENCNYFDGVDWREVKPMIEETLALRKTKDIQGLSELYFGFNSFKRKIHEELKKFRDEKNRGEIDYFSNIPKIWGDVDLAIDMLAKL